MNQVDMDNLARHLIREWGVKPESLTDELVPVVAQDTLRQAAAELAALRARVAGLEKAIDEVFEAYPADIFPSPSDSEYQAMNKEYSSFVTRHSADMGRRIAGIIRRRANELTEGELAAALGEGG